MCECESGVLLLAFLEVKLHPRRSKRRSDEGLDVMLMTISHHYLDLFFFLSFGSEKPLSICIKLCVHNDTSSPLRCLRNANGGLKASDEHTRWI